MRQQAGYATVIFVLFSLSISANHVDEYIQNYQNIAQQEMRRSGIPASIIIAQGIHESSWGKGELAIESKNHFGIKCKDYWTGPTYYIEDDDYQNGKLVKSCFRAYENVEASYIDHTNFLLESERYKDLFTYPKTDYRRWAKGLKECGYATDPNYAEKLVRIIEKYQLYQFDTILEQIMDAPKFYIPKEFFNNNNEVSDPVMYTYQEGKIELNTIQENNYIEQTSIFDYQVPAKEVPVKEEVAARIEIKEQKFDQITEDQVVFASYNRNQNSVIPNNSSKDKRIKNLTRKPRMDRDAGPR
jgi:mannosyl-glycoprotein endo-beta-N-acetylglucosaminidase